MFPFRFFVDIGFYSSLLFGNVLISSVRADILGDGQRGNKQQKDFFFYSFFAFQCKEWFKSIYRSANSKTLISLIYLNNYTLLAKSMLFFPNHLMTVILS